MKRSRVLSGLALAAIGAYLLAVAVDVVLRRDLEVLRASELSASAGRIARAEVERLLTSGLIVDGPLPWLQLAGLALASGLVVARLGAGGWWRAALAGHVGSALVVYAAVWIALSAGDTTAEHVVAEPDFGISCVAAGLVGALAVDAGRRRGRARRSDRLVLAGALAALAGFAAVSLSPYGSEHIVAYVLGAAVTAGAGPWRAALRPIASRARAA